MMPTKKRKIDGKTYTLYESGRSHLIGMSGRTKENQKQRASQLRRSFPGISFRVLKGVGGAFDIYRRAK